MMRLPALEPRERAYLQALLPGSPVRTFARRLQQRLHASLGVRVDVCEAPCDRVRAVSAGDEPVIVIEPALTAAWLGLRLGGRPGAAEPARLDDRLAAPFAALIRRSLAESVVNSGETAWPQSMRLSLSMGGQTGAAEIFWNSAHALAWARRTLREKA